MDYKEIIESDKLTDLDVQIIQNLINDFISARENYAHAKVRLFNKLEEYAIKPRQVITDWDNKI